MGGGQGGCIIRAWVRWCEYFLKSSISRKTIMFLKSKQASGGLNLLEIKFKLTICGRGEGGGEL